MCLKIVGEDKHADPPYSGQFASSFTALVFQKVFNLVFGTDLGINLPNKVDPIITLDFKFSM